MAKGNMTNLARFRHRIVLATSFVASVNETDIVLVREQVKEVWASITPVRGEFFINGIAQKENRNSYSHDIVIRYNSSMDISGYAWIYEDRPSGKRWYKVTSVQEIDERGRFWCIQARLVQKSDEAQIPSQNIEDFAKLPAGAVL